MVRLLNEIGPMEQNGPISYTELQAYQKATGTRLGPWEAKTLRALSVAYVDEHVAASDPLRPAPYVDPKTEEKNREAVAKRFKNSMSSYFMAKGKK